MAIYSDSFIEYWAAEFMARDLFNSHGIRFDTFLLDPEGILAAVATLPADRAPLLPHQAQVMHRDLEEALVPAGAELRGEGYVQPLRHHAYALSAAHRRATK